MTAENGASRVKTLIRIAESTERWHRCEMDRREALGEEGRKVEDEARARAYVEKYGPAPGNKCKACDGEVVQYYRSYHPEYGGEGDSYSKPTCTACKKTYLVPHPDSPCRKIGSRGEWIKRRANVMNREFNL